LDIFWADKEVVYNYKANITGNKLTLNYLSL